MGNFSNLRTYAKPRSCLTQEEINVIVAVLYEVINDFGHPSASGSFALSGQKIGESKSDIVRLNLKNGPLYFSQFEGGLNSESIIQDTFSEILQWPEVKQGKAIPSYHTGEAAYFGMLPSKIYKDARASALVLNATNGRFLAGYFADSGCSSASHDDGTMLLAVVAEVLAQLGQKDKFLQKSVNRIRKTMTAEEDKPVRFMHDLFDDCSLPVLKEWNEWREVMCTYGEPGLFFE